MSPIAERLRLLVLLILSVFNASAQPLEWMAPANSHLWVMRLADEKPEYLLATSDDEGEFDFRGMTGWSGKSSGSGTRITVSKKDRSIKFKRGIRLGATEGPVVKRLSELWAGKVNRDGDVVKDIWGGGGRLRLWYSSPNLLASLCASLALVGLGGLLFCSRMAIRLGGGMLALFGFVLLIMTGSRGAFVGFLAGAALQGVVYFVRSFSWRKLVLLGGMLLAGAMVLVFSGFGARFTSKLFEKSATNVPRIELAAAATRMIHDNPSGWRGLCPSEGTCAYAYCDWYKPLMEFKGWQTFLNNHLQVIVYGGCLWGSLYVFGWIFLLASLCWARRWVAATVFLSFGLAACFNPVLDNFSLWIIPIGCVAVAAYPLRRPKIRRIVILFVGALVLASCVVWGIVQVGAHQPEPEGAPFRASDGRVILGGIGADAEVGSWVVDDDIVLSGGFPGFAGGELRTLYAEEDDLPPLGYVREFQYLPSSAAHIVVTGEKCAELVDAFRANQLPPSFAGDGRTVVFLSPSLTWREIPDDFVRRFNLTMVVGEFAALVAGDRRDHPKWVKIVRGAELYIPGWMRFCVN